MEFVVDLETFRDRPETLFPAFGGRFQPPGMKFEGDPGEAREAFRTMYVYSRTNANYVVLSRPVKLASRVGPQPGRATSQFKACCPHRHQHRIIRDRTWRARSRVLRRDVQERHAGDTIRDRNHTWPLDGFLYLDDFLVEFWSIRSLLL